MDSTGLCPESRKRVIRELTHGQDLARRLQPLLQKPLGDNGSQLVGELLEMILRSFDLGLHQLGPSSDQIGESVLNCSVGHHQISGCDSGDTGEGSEGSSGTKKRPLLRDSRGCYKRRKSAQTRATVSPTMEDGQAWRKYGQKFILNAKFPRSYFRCTHKYDQGCKATKQVQRMEDDSGMYQTTYFGFHTCNRDPINPPQFIILDNSEPGDNNFIVIPEEDVKEEIEDQVETKSDLTVVGNVSFCSALPENSSFHQADHLIGFEHSSPYPEHNQDAISRMYRLDMKDDEAHSEMELLFGGSLGFRSDFPFDDSDFS